MHFFRSPQLRKPQNQQHCLRPRFETRVQDHDFVARRDSRLMRSPVDSRDLTKLSARSSLARLVTATEDVNMFDESS